MIGIPQTTRASCGQTCIAMVIQRPVAEVFARLADRTRGTKAAELAACLRSFGRSTSGRLIRCSGGVYPPLAILRVLWPEHPRNGHWMLIRDGRIFDPDGPRERWRQAGGRITSYLEIYGPTG